MKTFQKHCMTQKSKITEKKTSNKLVDIIYNLAIKILLS